MAFEFKLPDIGEGLAEGEIVKWLVAEGDEVEEDEPLVEVMTDKATVEIPSPRGGRILELRAREGEVVEIGTTIVVFGEAREVVPAGEVEPADEAPLEKDTPAAAEEVPAPAEEAPADIEELPAAVEEAPEPVEEAPTSVEEAPEPVEEAPEPVEEAPTSADTKARPAVAFPSMPQPAEKTKSREVTEDDLEQAREVARAERSVVEAETARPWEMPAAPAAIVQASPATRRLARELDIDLSEVAGSGAGGRITKEDVRAFARGDAMPAPVEAVEATAVPEPAAELEPTPEPEPTAELEKIPMPEPTPPPAEGPLPEPEITPAAEFEEPEPTLEEPVVEPVVAPPADEELEERVPLRGLRRTIAERMVASKTTVPHYTYVEEVDMTEVVQLREEAKPMAAERGVKLTYLPFIIRALVLALQEHPYVNASLDEEAGEIVLKRYYNIGIATDTDRGLIVPVIENADRLDLFGLAAEIARLAAAARDGSISIDELRGGTFTITSTGHIGGLIATPIVNLPEVAILGVTRIRERPVVRDGKIVPRHMLNFSLSLDHRVVDGAVGARFMEDLVKLLEDPKLQLLGGL